MAKSMARIQNGVVTNIEWVGDYTAETAELRNIRNIHVRIGDTYSNGLFYRDGIKVLSHREKIQKMITDYDTSLSEIEAFILTTMALTTNESEITLDSRKQNVLNYLGAIMEALNKDGEA